jgi:hypothetical protein
LLLGRDQIHLREEVGHVALGSRWFRQVAVQRGLDPETTYFDLVRAFLKAQPIATESAACHLGPNEVYGRIRGSNVDLATLARDDTDYKALIVKARDTAEKLALAQRLATRRLAVGVLPQLDACFAALGLAEISVSNVVPLARQAQ